MGSLRAGAAGSTRRGGGRATKFTQQACVTGAAFVSLAGRASAGSAAGVESAAWQLPEGLAAWEAAGASGIAPTSAGIITPLVTAASVRHKDNRKARSFLNSMSAL